MRFSNKRSNYFFEDVFLGDEVEKIHSNVQTLQIVGEKEGGGLMSKQPELVTINNTMKFAIQQIHPSEYQQGKNLQDTPNSYVPLPA